ncbi:MAG: ShlB/FhaC/HecB family hemolysin secretion/activation protein [Verrucomicrobiaceae bacterium]|nr:ShlB/FhaC/HecB family hemolysin secretion/activation protein [Verrucomicrobiaceae bacterium]
MPAIKIHPPITNAPHRSRRRMVKRVSQSCLPKFVLAVLGIWTQSTVITVLGAESPSAVTVIHVINADSSEVAQLEGGVVIGAKIPGARRLERELSRYLGQRADETLLGLLADVVVEHLRRESWPVSLVTVWDDDGALIRGSVILQVQQGRVGDLAIVGGSARRQRTVAKRLASLVDQPLDGMTLQRRLDALAFSPWLACAPEAVPGNSLDTANLVLTLEEQSPVHAFASYENNGVSPLGQNRHSLGVQWLNGFGLGHDLTVLATVSDDPEVFSMIAGSWRIPLPWRHELRFSGYYAETLSTSEVLSIPLDVDGTTWETGVRYMVPWRINQEWRSEWSVGFDYKQFDTAFTFGSTAAAVDSTGVGTVNLSTIWYYDSARDHLRFGLDFVHGEPGWAAGQTEEQFNQLVAGASPRFNIVRGVASYQHDFSNDMQAAWRVGAQWSDGPLLPSEELTLASINVVRGYPERSYRASRGAWASVEARGPEWELWKARIKFRPLAFFDVGYTADESLGCGCSNSESAESEDPEKPMEGEDFDDFIASAGIGVRLELTKYVHLRCDLAFPLIHRNEPRVQLAAVVRF